MLRPSQQQIAHRVAAQSADCALMLVLWHLMFAWWHLLHELRRVLVVRFPCHLDVEVRQLELRGFKVMARIQALKLSFFSYAYCVYSKHDLVNWKYSLRTCCMISLQQAGCMEVLLCCWFVQEFHQHGMSVDSLSQCVCYPTNLSLLVDMHCVVEL